VVGDEAAAAQVDHLDLAPAVALDQDVFGLEVGVDQAEGVEERQGLKHLVGWLGGVFFVWGGGGGWCVCVCWEGC